MLLDLLQHHENIFLAVIRPLTLRRDRRSLAALGASCQQIHQVITKISFWRHMAAFGPTYNAIKRINYAYYENTSMIEYNNKLTHTYLVNSFNANRWLYGYNKFIHSVLYTRNSNKIFYIVSEHSISIKSRILRDEQNFTLYVPEIRMKSWMYKWIDYITVLGA